MEETFIFAYDCVSSNSLTWGNTSIANRSQGGFIIILKGHSQAKLKCLKCGYTLIDVLIIHLVPKKWGGVGMIMK